MYTQNWYWQAQVCGYHCHTYTHRKSHKCGWYWHTHDCPEGGRSFLDTLFCTPVTSRWSPVTACPCPRSPPGRGNWTLVEILHTQIVAVNLCTGHECHLKSKVILMSSSTPQLATLKWSIKHKILFKLWPKAANHSQDDATIFRSTNTVGRTSLSLVLGNMAVARQILLIFNLSYLPCFV